MFKKKIEPWFDFYRVECRVCKLYTNLDVGLGPYTTCYHLNECDANTKNYPAYLNYLEGNHAATYNHPGMFKDDFKFGGLFIASSAHQYFCGFTSMDQLERWFSIDERSELHNYGFHIVKYKVKQRTYSYYQALSLIQQGFTKEENFSLVQA